MKKCFVIGLITALIPMANSVAAQKTIDLLMAEKQAKIKKLEACKGTTKNLKIAGISTLGVTAVGVGANIAEAVVLNDYDNKVKKEQKELLKQQDLNKKLKADQEAAKQAAIAAANQPQCSENQELKDGQCVEKTNLIDETVINVNGSFTKKEALEYIKKWANENNIVLDISKDCLSPEQITTNNIACEDKDYKDYVFKFTEIKQDAAVEPKKQEKQEQEDDIVDNFTIDTPVRFNIINQEIANNIIIRNPNLTCDESSTKYIGNNVYQQVCSNKTITVTIPNINCGDNKQWNKSSGQCTNLAKKTKTCKDGYKYDTVKKLCVEKTPEQNLIQMRLDFDAAQSSPNCPGGVCYDQNIKVCQSPKYLYDNDCVSNQDILNKYCVGQGARQTSYGALICEIDFSKERYSSGQDGLNRAKTWASHIPNITCDNPIINTIGDDVINCHVGQVTFKFIFDALNAKSNEPGLGESLQKGMEAKSQRMGAFGF